MKGICPTCHKAKDCYPDDGNYEMCKCPIDTIPNGGEVRWIIHGLSYKKDDNGKWVRDKG